MTEAPVLLVHGFASSFERNWVEPGWVALLSDAGREVIGVDLLGHGLAERPHAPSAYDDLEVGVERVLPDSRPVDAVGFSLGARVLLTVASRQPSRFRRIVVGGVGASLLRERPDPEPVARAIEGSGDGSDVVATTFARFATAPGNDPKALAACLRRAEEPLATSELARIVAPVLVVLGDHDFAGPGEPLVSALPDARLVSLPGVDHLGTPDSFGFIEATLDFLGAQPP